MVIENGCRLDKRGYVCYTSTSQKFCVSGGDLVEYSFDFSYLKNGSPVVTLSSLGIAFNRGAVDMLGAPGQVIVGYDEKKVAVGVRARGEDTTAPYFDFAPRVRNDWVRIGAKDFVKYLARVSKIDFLNKAKQFIPEYDPETKTLIIIIDEKHMK